MAANTPTVRRFEPFLRAGQSQTIYPTAQWVDNLVLAPGAAKSYVVPTGTDVSRGSFAQGSSAPAGATVSATIFRVTASGGPVWLNANGGIATVPVADNIAGNGVVCIPPGMGYWFSMPVSAQPLSFIADQAVTLAIEAWF